MRAAETSSCAHSPPIAPHPHLRPLAAVLALFLALMALSRVDLTIARGPEWRAAQQSQLRGDAMASLAALAASARKSIAAVAAARDSAAPKDVTEASAKADAAVADAKHALNDVRCPWVLLPHCRQVRPLHRKPSQPAHCSTLDP